MLMQVNWAEGCEVVRCTPSSRFELILRIKMNMKKYIIAFCALTLVGTVQAGNPQRAGSAGASELLINPFALHRVGAL